MPNNHVCKSPNQAKPDRENLRTMKLFNLKFTRNKERSKLIPYDSKLNSKRLFLTKKPNILSNIYNLIKRLTPKKKNYYKKAIYLFKRLLTKRPNFNIKVRNFDKRTSI